MINFVKEAQQTGQGAAVRVPGVVREHGLAEHEEGVDVGAQSNVDLAVDGHICHGATVPAGDRGGAQLCKIEVDLAGRVRGAQADLLCVCV